MPRLLIFLTIFISQASFGSELTLPATLKARLEHLVSNYPSGFAAEIRDMHNRQIIFSGNREVSLNPASVMKLLTTKAAIDLLGIGFRWNTDVLTKGIIKNNTLDGDLYFRGSGDPTMDLVRFNALLKSIYDVGIHSIEGNVVIDRSNFPDNTHDPGHFDNEPLRPYNVGADALPINANVFNIHFIPRPETQTVDLISSPLNAPVVNQLQVSTGACAKWPKNPIIENGQIYFRGAYPLSCGIKQRQYSLLSPSLFFENAFRTEWATLGGTFDGSILENKTPNDAKMFLESTSEPIASALRVTNKWSSNLAARNIFLTLSLQLSEQADLEISRTLVKRWAENHGISTKGVFIDNGSGLSRNGRVTVAAVSKILNVAWLDPSMPEFISSFSVPGVDGTLKSKFHSSPVNAKAHLKTGYLEGVRSIAGYLHLPQGQTLSVVIIMNHESLTKSSRTMENLVESLFQTK